MGAEEAKRGLCSTRSSGSAIPGSPVSSVFVSCQQDTPSHWRPLASYHSNARTNWGKRKSWHTAQKSSLKNRNRLSGKLLERQEKAARGVSGGGALVRCGESHRWTHTMPRIYMGWQPHLLPTLRFLFSSLLHLPYMSLPPTSLGNLLSHGRNVSRS